MKTLKPITTILETARRPLRREALRRERIESQIDRYAPPKTGPGRREARPRGDPPAVRGLGLAASSPPVRTSQGGKTR